jgi:hypothetical protein
MKLDLTAPDHSTLSRGWRQLRITLPVKDWFNSRHLVVERIKAEREKRPRSKRRASSHSCAQLSFDWS